MTRITKERLIKEEEARLTKIENGRKVTKEELVNVLIDTLLTFNLVIAAVGVVTTLTLMLT